MDTDTRIHRTDDVVARLARHHNNGDSHYDYVARHSTDNPPRPIRPPEAHVRTQVFAAVVPGESTRRIDVGQLQVPVVVRPPAPTPAPHPELVVSVPQPPEPAAVVDVPLLRRVLSTLRRRR
jgi:hypothetical protein